MRSISRDGKLVLAAKTLRSLGYGLLSVVLGLYLEEAGFPPVRVGIILTLTLAGSALLTAVMTAYADRLGRRRILILSAMLMIASGLAFAITQNIWLLGLAALSGTISSTSGEVGPFETVEQAILPQTTGSENRNRAFGWYHTLGALAVSLGAWAAALPSWIQSRLSVDILVAHRLMFGMYAALAALSLMCLIPLSKRVEMEPTLQEGRRRLLPLHRSRKTITKLAALFGLDALGGGFVIQSLLAYWFALRFQVGGDVLGPVFLGVNLMKAVSYPMAVKVANRLGLINTMVFTHLPSNVALILIPLMPNLSLAIVCLLVRHLLSQMDVPTRSSYVVAIVEPDERTAATGLTSLVRTITQAFGPVFAGFALQFMNTGAPFFLGGGLKIVYDLALYYNFRTLRTPEEQARYRREKGLGKDPRC